MKKGQKLKRFSREYWENMSDNAQFSYVRKLQDENVQLRIFMDILTIFVKNIKESIQDLELENASDNR